MQCFANLSSGLHYCRQLLLDRGNRLHANGTIWSGSAVASIPGFFRRSLAISGHFTSGGSSLVFVTIGSNLFIFVFLRLANTNGIIGIGSLHGINFEIRSQSSDSSHVVLLGRNEMGDYSRLEHLIDVPRSCAGIDHNWFINGPISRSADLTNKEDTIVNDSCLLQRPKSKLESCTRISFTNYLDNTYVDIELSFMSFITTEKWESNWEANWGKCH